MPSRVSSCRYHRRSWPALVYVTLTLTAAACRADIGKWGVLGPPSSQVQGTYLAVPAALIDPTTTAILYAGTVINGVFKSTDGGYSWTPGGPPSGPGQATYCLAFDPSSSARIYDGTLGDVYKTTDSSTTWNSAFRSPAQPAPALLFDPSAPLTGYSATNTSALYKTTDGAASWTATGSPGAPVWSLVMDSSNLWAGTSSGVSKSTSGGSFWNVSACGDPEPAQPPVTALVVDPTSSTTLYAGTSGSGAGSGVFKSSVVGFFGCLQWTAMNTGLPTDSKVLALVLDSAASNTLYAGTDGGGVFKTTDGGTSWVSLTALGGLDNLSVKSLMLDPSAHSRIYAGTNTGPGAGLYHLQQDVATSFYSLTPCRLVNTAGGAPLGGGALAAQTPRAFSLADVGTCGVPKNAIALSLNITAVSPSTGGNLKIYAPGAPTPTATALSMRAGRALANNAIVAVGSGATMVVFDNQPSGTAGLIVDVNGYFAPPP